MANDSDSRDGVSDAAKASLSDLASDRAIIAGRVTTPVWYHPILGVIFALILIGITVASPLGTILVILAAMGTGALVGAYSRRSSVWVSRPKGPRSARLLAANLVVVAASLVAALWIRFSGVSWAWALIPVAVTFVAVVTIGPKYDRALRSELSRPETGRR